MLYVAICACKLNFTTIHPCSLLLIVLDQKPSEKRQMIFTFDLSDIKNLREASQLQLRLFKRRSKQRTFYYVHLYQILENNINNASCGNKRLISSQFIRQKSRGEWLVFDVTSLFNSQENVPTTMIQSFLIEVKAVKDDTKSTRVSIVKSGRKQPFILIFFRNPRQPLSHSEVETPVELSIDKFPFGKTRFPRTATSLDRQNELCSRRKNLRINFHQLGMTNILVPKDYDAYYCAGTCPVYSGEKIYSFLRNRQQLENGKVFTGCCVPTEYGTLDVLYLHEKGVTYARFQGMVVLSCGCR